MSDSASPAAAYVHHALCDLGKPCYYATHTGAHEYGEWDVDEFCLGCELVCSCRLIEKARVFFIEHGLGETQSGRAAQFAADATGSVHPPKCDPDGIPSYRVERGPDLADPSLFVFGDIERVD